MQRRLKRIFSVFFLLGFLIIGTNNIVAQNCNTPTNLSTTTISNFSATLNWDADSSVDHYRLRYQESGASSWMYNHNVPAGNFYNLTGLDTSVSYEWQLKAFCSAGSLPSSGWSALQTFTTINLPVDCNNTPNGTAFLDSCANCVGGTTGNLPCIAFTPTVSMTLASLECDLLTDFSFTFSQDPNEPDVASAFFTSDGGYFDFSGISVNDTVGSSVNMIAGGQIPAHNITTTLLVDFIVNSDKISVKALDDITGQLYSSFTIENTSNGILIIINSLPDNNNVTQGNSQWVVLTGLFTNPIPSILTFTSTITSELGTVDIQTTSETIDCTDCNNDFGGTAFTDSCGNCVGGNTGNISCIPFSPNVGVILSDTTCDSLSNLTINVSQDPNEPDMSTSSFTSDGGYFNITSMSVGDTVGSAIMSANGGTLSFNTILIVSSIISSNQAILQSTDINTGFSLGTFTISNISGGINILGQSVPDNNNVTQGNSSSVTFDNIFVNPGSSTLTFTSVINSETGDVDTQSFAFNIICGQTCPQLGDANCDNIVNLTDLTLVINHWLQSTSVGQNGDVVGSLDGFVNLTDLTLVINNWLQSTP